MSLKRKETKFIGKFVFELHVKTSAKDAHYDGNLVDDTHMLHLFGDMATKLLIRCGGSKGLLYAYDNIEFLVPVYIGGYTEAKGEITYIENTSHKMTFTMYKVIIARLDVNAPVADILDEPVLVCRASGTRMIPKSCERKQTIAERVPDGAHPLSIRLSDKRGYL